MTMTLILSLLKDQHIGHWFGWLAVWLAYRQLNAPNASPEAIEHWRAETMESKWYGQHQTYLLRRSWAINFLYHWFGNRIKVSRLDDLVMSNPVHSLMQGGACVEYFLIGHQLSGGFAEECWNIHFLPLDCEEDWGQIAKVTGSDVIFPGNPVTLGDAIAGLGVQWKELYNLTNYSWAYSFKPYILEHRALATGEHHLTIYKTDKFDLETYFQKAVEEALAA